MDREVTVTYEDEDGKEWDVRATVRAGCAEVPLSMAGPGLPADPPEMEDIVLIYGAQEVSVEDAFPNRPDVHEAIEEALWEAADDR